VLHDEIEIEALLEQVQPAAPEPLPTEAELDQLCDDLWYHGLWTAKKLRRGELWAALECLDSYLRYRLLALLRLRARLDGRSPWHGVRFAEQWVGEPRDVIASTFAGYDEADVADALWALLDLAGRLEAELRGRLGLDSRDRTEVVELIERVQAR
jgi:aminoglycoside 6-adenylyltransferase